MTQQKPKFWTKSIGDYIIHPVLYLMLDMIQMGVNQYLDISLG